MPLDKFNELSGFPKDSYLIVMSPESIAFPNDQIQSITSKAELIHGFQTMMKTVNGFIGAMGGVAFVLGLIVILLVTSMVVEESKFSISMMKILGYRNKEIFSLILNINNGLVIFGFILAVPLVLLTVGGIFDSVGSEMNLTIPATIEWINVLIGFVLLLGTYELAKWISRRKVLSITMVEALKGRGE